MRNKIVIALGILVLAGLIIFTRKHPAAPAPAPSAATTAADASAGTRPAVRARLPAPRVDHTTAPIESQAEPTLTNLLARLHHDGETVKLTHEQVDPYLAANRRNAASLLAAARATGDTNLLREAMEKFPHDPMVDFAAVFRNGTTPEDRRQWLDTFKESAPDNALVNYLSAGDYLKAGATDQAVQELQAAYGKKNFQDYSLEFLQSAEEAYRTAGYGDAEAKAVAFTELLLPHLAPLKQTGVDAIELAKTYRQSGDEESAQAVLQMALSLGNQLQHPGTFNPLINELVGIAIERRALDVMNPSAAYGSGQTVQGRIDELASYRNSIRDLNKVAWPLVEAMPASEAALYFERTKTFGELSAMRWIVEKYGTPK